MCKACEPKEVDWSNPEDIVIKTFESLRGTSILVGILKHYGKLEVPRSIFNELLTEQQLFPNDFITKNGSMAAVTYDRSTDKFGFELGYMDEKPYPENIIGFSCTRAETHVGPIEYSDPYYRN
jgi:hypothetical protein